MSPAVNCFQRASARTARCLRIALPSKESKNSSSARFLHYKFQILGDLGASALNGKSLPSHIYPYLERFTWSRSKHSWSHSWWKKKGMCQTLAIDMPRMLNSNIEIRIAGSSWARNKKNRSLIHELLIRAFDWGFISNGRDFLLKIWALKVSSW